MADEEMKTCPFCGGEIKKEAIKCKHCGKFLDGRSQGVNENIPEYIRLSDVVKYAKITALGISLIGVIILAIWIIFYDLKSNPEITPIVRGILLIWLTQLFLAIKNHR